VTTDGPRALVLLPLAAVAWAAALAAAIAGLVALGWVLDALADGSGVGLERLAQLFWAGAGLLAVVATVRRGRASR
jgi:hypothetical protein